VRAAASVNPPPNNRKPPKLNALPELDIASITYYAVTKKVEGRRHFSPQNHYPAAVAYLVFRLDSLGGNDSLNRVATGFKSQNKPPFFLNEN